MMQYEAEHAGKWVVSKGEKVIASDVTFTKLKKKIKDREDFAHLEFALIPKGPVIG